MRTLYWAMMKSAKEYSSHVRVPWIPEPMKFVTYNQPLLITPSSSLSEKDDFSGTNTHVRHYSTTPGGNGPMQSHENFERQNVAENFLTAASAAYGKRLMAAVSDRSLASKSTTIESLQAGLNLTKEEIEEAHEKTMQFAQNSVNLNGKPYTSPEGVKALNELNELETILGAPIDVPRLLNRLLNEHDSFK